MSKILTVDNITKIELATHGQSDNENWFMFRKGVITGSKGHEVKIKMEKLYKGNGAVVNLWNVFQKNSGLTFVNPNIVSLKYGRAMEPNAANAFFDLLSKQHKNFKLIDCGLFLDKDLPYVGASPDRIISCDCCPQAVLEIKCPYSINHLQTQRFSSLFHI